MNDVSSGAVAAEGSPVLVVLAHPYPHQSRVNRRLAARVGALPGVRVHDLYACYPDFDIDAAHDRQLLLDARLVVFQHPMFWYSAPALLKEWQDVVLSRGFAFGHKGTALRGKDFLHVISVGGSPRAYSRDGGHRFTIEEFLRPFEQMARLCGMHSLGPLVLHDAHHCPPDSIERHAESYVAALRPYLLGQTAATTEDTEISGQP